MLSWRRMPLVRRLIEVRIESATLRAFECCVVGAHCTNRYPHMPALLTLDFIGHPGQPFIT